MMNISPDHERFRNILKGKIKKELGKYIINEDLIGRQGKELVKIPVSRINIPRFTYGLKTTGGIGQGEGEEGDEAGFDPLADDQGGLEPGEHIMNVEMSIDEMTDMLVEELGLPYLEPKGENMQHERQSKATVRKYGVRKDTKRTLKNALQRHIASGDYNPEKPLIIPVKNDFRYLVAEKDKEKNQSVVIIYIMDISYSMGDREICEVTNDWLERVIKREYRKKNKNRKIEERYIVHDAVAKEVGRREFYQLSSAGGTRLSAPYELAIDMIKKEYSPDLWNIYIFQHSDGENQGNDDNQRCKQLLAKEILPQVQLFGYGQCKQPTFMGKSSEGDYIEVLYQNFHLNDTHQHLKKKVRLSKLYGRKDILPTIKEFLHQ